MSATFNQELYEKATNVFWGIKKLIWACNFFYINKSVDEAIKEYGIEEVYVNESGRLTVKLDDGTEYCLVLRPPLIYELYDAKAKFESGEKDKVVTRQAEAYDKFEPFFNWMINYKDTPVIG